MFAAGSEWRLRDGERGVDYAGGNDLTEQRFSIASDNGVDRFVASDAIPDYIKC
jgi:hypothetical protein